MPSTLAASVLSCPPPSRTRRGRLDPGTTRRPLRPGRVYRENSRVCRCPSHPLCTITTGGARHGVSVPHQRAGTIRRRCCGTKSWTLSSREGPSGGRVPQTPRSLAPTRVSEGQRRPYCRLSTTAPPCKSPGVTSTTDSRAANVEGGGTEFSTPAASVSVIPAQSQVAEPLMGQADP